MKVICKKCGTWVCHTCWDYRRRYANRAGVQVCAKCGGNKGEFLPVRHFNPRKHAEAE